jgi:putative addiction module component (TIGR02574 family)
MAVRSELRRELMALSPEDRQELADELYESLPASDDPEWQRAWAVEIDRRARDVVDNRVELIDADEVHDALQSELHAKR